MAAMAAMTAMAEQMDERARGQDQQRQILQAQREVRTVLGQQVERRDGEQKPESEAQLPGTLGAGAICMESPPWDG
jgi:hypothetical protein